MRARRRSRMAHLGSGTLRSPASARGARLASLVAVLAAAACGTEGSDPAASAAAAENPSANGADASAPATVNVATDGGRALAADPIVGLCDVSGNDARGAYQGQAEIRLAAAGYTFVRTVRYANVTVERDRDLHWLITGTLTRSGST